MNAKTKQGLKVLEAALLLGILGDGLLRATPWGLNVLLWTGAITIALVFLMMRARRRALLDGGHWLLLPVILSAAAFAWRDSLALNFLAGMTLLVSLSLMAWRARAGRIWLGGIAEYLKGMFLAGVNAFFIGFPLLMRDVSWREIPAAGRTRHLRSALLGVFIAIPLLVVFGLLFISADAAFENIVRRLFFTNQEEIFGHVFLALFLAWITGGFLRGLLFGREVKITSDGRATLVSANQADTDALGTQSNSAAPQTLKIGQGSLGIVEIGVTLGLLNLLFFVFVLLQLRYFFGGASLIQASGGMTFAEYYRRGFFELVTVAALVLPILLAAHWLLRKDNPANERVFRVLAATQIVLLFVIMVSAVRRMLLYQSEYGLTELRLYTTAFMVWLALVFGWFAVTVLRGRRNQFAFGALIAGFLIVGTLHVINPDAFIVRVNVAHAQHGRAFDAYYASSLSADAMPALMQSLPALKVEDQQRIASEILGNWSLDESSDWRTWNWSRSQASHVLQDNFELLKQLTPPPQVVNQVTTVAPETIRVQVSDAASQVKSPTTKPKIHLTPKRKGKIRYTAKPAYF